MKLFETPQETDEKPVFVNGDGFSWYFSDVLMERIQDSGVDAPGKPLDNVVGFVVWGEDGKRSGYALVNKTGKMLYDSKSAEQVLYQIDFMRLGEAFKEEDVD